MLGTAAPSHHHYDDELIGGEATESNEESPQVINEDLDSLDDLLSQVVKQEDAPDGNEE
ncbi:MAG: hypothetical protein LKE37_03650 [Atopobiaceae bacterium]|nr:hypothetical protein [Atopobiaceae bacterium]